MYLLLSEFISLFVLKFYYGGHGYVTELECPSVPSTERDLLKRKIGHMKFEADWEDHNQRKAVAV